MSRESDLAAQLRAEKLVYAVKCVAENYDWVPFAEAYFQIKPPNGVIQPFKANFIQQKIRNDRVDGYLHTKRLKVRRHGSTTAEIYAAIAYMLCIPNFNVVVASDDIQSATRIVQQMIRPLIANLHPDALSLVDKVDLVQRELRVTHRKGLGESTMFIGGLRDESFGLGYDVHYLIVTEAAYITKKGWETIGNILEALPIEASIVCFESTANGVGNEFHDLYISDKWRRQFYPWWTREDAYLPPGESNIAKGLPKHLWGDFALTDREQMWVQQHNLSIDQVRFYRWRELVAGDLVRQYYPSTAEEAFLSSGKVMFPVQPLESAYNLTPPVLLPLENERDIWVKSGWSSNQLVEDLDEFGVWQGLKVWRRPEMGHSYTIGIDSAEGEVDHDLSVCQVINNHTGEQVAMLRGYLRPDEIANQAVYLAEYFNHAYIIPEKNGIGAAVCQQLEHVYHYDNCFRHDPEKPVGYNMTRSHKMELFGMVSKALESYSLKINDRTTIREMLTYRVSKTGNLSAPEGKHDDCVTSLMLAYSSRAAGQTSSSNFQRKRTGHLYA